jgi:thiol-disulfide isomerase/thioredoxin
MRNKTIFTTIVALLFIASALTGMYWPNMVASYHATRDASSFVPASVPERETANFGGQFNKVLIATEPQRLPENSFVDIDGKKVRIADFAGKPTLVNIWATWCPPCVIELPSLEKLAKHYDGKLNVIAIALEEGKAPKDIAAFLEKRPVGRFAGYLDQSGDFRKNLGLRGVPTSFLIGSDGLILYRFEGDADWTSPDSQAFFDLFLLQKR